jgi:hypothetical protein
MVVPETESLATLSQSCPNSGTARRRFSSASDANHADAYQARACVSDLSGAKSATAIAIRRNVSKARFILVALILAAPALLLWDELIVQGLVAGILATALIISAYTFRPGETAFLVSVIRPPAIVAAVLALWVIVQVLPLGVFAHPIWKSAEAALKHPIAGTISVDPGASVVALGQYLSLTAVAFLSAAVAVDRQRAEWILFALTGSVTSIALIALLHDLLFAGAVLPAFAQAQALDCASMGAIIAGAGCIRTIERYQTRDSNPLRSVPATRLTLIGCSAALAICGSAVIVRATPEVLFATGYGLLALASVVIIRRFRFGLWLAGGVATCALAVAVLLATAHLLERGTGILLAFSTAHSASLSALSERVLGDAPLFGTGAGTFAAVAPIYREMDDPRPGSVAATAAATFAIELGAPMLWLTVAATVACIIMLLRASLQRGRDSFYPAMGGSCLITLLLLAFANPGLLGAATGLIVAATLGLAFAQSKSRTMKI